MSEMNGLTLSVIKNITNTNNRRKGGVQRDQYSQQKSQNVTHGRTISDVLKLTERRLTSAEF